MPFQVRPSARRRRHHGGMTTDVLDAAQALAQAVLRHAELVVGVDAPGRQEAGLGLVSALDAYGVAVINSGNELPKTSRGVAGGTGRHPASRTRTGPPLGPGGHASRRRHRPPRGPRADAATSGVAYASTSSATSYSSSAGSIAGLSVTRRSLGAVPESPTQPWPYRRCMTRRLMFVHLKAGYDTDQGTSHPARRPTASSRP